MINGMTIFGVLILTFGAILFFVMAPKMEFMYWYRVQQWAGGVVMVLGFLVIGVSFYPSILEPNSSPQVQAQVAQHNEVQRKYHHALLEMKTHAGDMKQYNYWNAEAQLLKEKLMQLDTNE